MNTYAEADLQILFCGTKNATVNRQDDYQAILVVRLEFCSVERSHLFSLRSVLNHIHL